MWLLPIATVRPSHACHTCSCSGDPCQRRTLHVARTVRWKCGGAACARSFTVSPNLSCNISTAADQSSSIIELGAWVLGDVLMECNCKSCEWKFGDGPARAHMIMIRYCRVQSDHEWGLSVCPHVYGVHASTLMTFSAPASKVKPGDRHACEGAAERGKHEERARDDGDYERGTAG